MDGTNGATGHYSFEVAQTTQTALPLGTPYSGTIAGTGQAQLFALQVTAAQPLSVVLSDTTAGDHTEMFASFGTLPTEAQYDYGSTAAGGSKSLLIPDANVGTWYVLVYAESVGAASSPFTLTATSAEAVLTGATPNTGATNATTTLTLAGAGFMAGATVTLVSSGGTNYPATTATVDLPTQMTATFAAGSVPAGTYAIKVTQADGSSTQLPNSFAMVASGVANLVTHLELPNPMSRHIAETLYIDYANTGTVAMPAPLLILDATNPQGQHGALFTLDPALRGIGLWTSATPVGFSQQIEMLASGGTPGVLQPGESERVPVYYAGWLTSQWDFSQPTLNFSLHVIQSNNAAPMNWTGATYVTGQVQVTYPTVYFSSGFYSVVPWVNGQPQSQAAIASAIQNGTVPLYFGADGESATIPEYLSQGATKVSFTTQGYDNEPGISQSPPPSVSAAAWAIIAASMETTAGSTSGGYVQLLDSEASYLG